MFFFVVFFLTIGALRKYFRGSKTPTPILSIFSIFDRKKYIFIHYFGKRSASEDRTRFLARLASVAEQIRGSSGNVSFCGCVD